MTTLGMTAGRANAAAWSRRALRWMGGAVLVASCQLALAADVPATLAGVTQVTADQARKMVDSGTPVIDTRVGNEYADAHIKGAKNVPYKEKSAKDPGFNGKDDHFDLAKLPADKNAPLIFYCNGPECWKSYKASKAAVDAGWKKVHWLRGGFPEWKANGTILTLPVEERSSARAESYRIKTAPLQAGSGRQAVIREVEVMVKSFHASSTVAVTINGSTQTSAAIPVGTNVVRFPFNQRGEYLDVQIAPASNASGYEAPVLEQFRVGVRNDGHTVRFL